MRTTGDLRATAIAREGRGFVLDLDHSHSHASDGLASNNSRSSPRMMVLRYSRSALSPRHRHLDTPPGALVGMLILRRNKGIDASTPIAGSFGS